MSRSSSQRVLIDDTSTSRRSGSLPRLERQLPAVFIGRFCGMEIPAACLHRLHPNISHAPPPLVVRVIFYFLMLPTLCSAALGLLIAISAQLLLTRQSLRFLGVRAVQPLPSESSPEWDEDFDFAPVPPPPQPSPPLSPNVLQPDEVRLQSGDMEGMRCGERIPPESVTETRDGHSRVSTFVRAQYKDSTDDGLHAWRYTVEFKNRGAHEVRLLTRHWVIVDANGKAEEIKGPGAKGAMPILKPGGGKFEYASGTRIATTSGSIHGWFTFEEVITGRLFPVRVARLALTQNGQTVDVPCKPPADASGGTLPATSVHTTERVFVGAIGELAHRDDDLRTFAFTVDLQVNNGRMHAVTVTGVKWEIIDAYGQRHLSEGTVGEQQAGGVGGAIKLAPGSALRLRTTLPQLNTPSAKISGVLLARFHQTDDDDGAGEASKKGGFVEMTYDDVDEEREIVIAPLGVSVDGGPVQSFEPLGFLP